MKTRYRIIMKIAGEYVMTDDQKDKEVDKWMNIYKNAQSAEEISIFERNDMTYKLIHKEHRRRIGF